jgi:DNA polymerase I
MTKRETLLIDGDIVLYKAAFLCENEFDWGDVVTYATSKESIRTSVDFIINKWIEPFSDFSKLIVCLSGFNNFRKELLPSYKSNRAGNRKPLGLIYARQYVEDNYATKCEDSMEADDLMGILQHKDSVIISIDKDMLTVPGHHYNPDKQEEAYISEAEANYTFYKQCLTGDNTDGYKGCPGIGEVKASKLLENQLLEYSMWEIVLGTYLKAGETLEDCITQCRMAYILRNHVGELWNPPVKNL